MRAQHIDVARGLCIAMVVMGHCELAGLHAEANSAMATFRMPLFFMLAGVFFRPGASVWDTARHKASALLKPCLVLALAYAPILVFKQSTPVATYVQDVLSFNGRQMPGWLFPLWFLPLLWALHVGLQALYPHRHQFQKHPLLHPAVVLALLAIGPLWMDAWWQLDLRWGEHQWTVQGLPFSLDLWPLAAGFFLTGYLLRDEILRWQISPVVAVGFAVLWAAILVLEEPALHMFERHHGPWLMSAIAAFSGAACCMSLAHVLSRYAAVRRLVSPLGRLSLYILLFHAHLVSLIQRQLKPVWPDQPELVAWLTWCGAILASFALGQIIQRVGALQMLFEPVHKGPSGKPALAPAPVPVQPLQPALPQ